MFLFLIFISKLDIITDHQRKAFEELKQKLITTPLYTHFINKNANKIIFCDAATCSITQKDAIISAVLCQVITPNNEDCILPEYINLKIPTDRVIYNNKLPYQPLNPVNELPLNKNLIPRIDIERKLGDFYGYEKEKIIDSPFLAIGVVLKFYGVNKNYSIKEIKNEIIEEMKKRPYLKNKLRDKDFKGSYKDLNEYLSNFANNPNTLDKHEIMLEALSLAFRRPVIMIYANKTLNPNNTHISKINSTRYSSPPICLGIVEKGEEKIFLPYIVNRDATFELSSIRGKLQVIAYFSKKLPTLLRSRSVLDLEAIALHSALFYFEKYVKATNCTLVTDSRALYFMFNKRVHDANVKINRWCLQIRNNFPTLRIQFIRTKENLADFLTRAGKIPIAEIKKLNLSKVDVEDFEYKLPKNNFTLQEWIQWVNDNPQYLKTTPKEINNTAEVLSASIKNLNDFFHPLIYIKEKLSRENIMETQKEEFKEIIQKCKTSEKFTCETILDKKNYLFNWDQGLLMIIGDDSDWQIIVPEKLVGTLLTYTHLQGHSSKQRMLDVYNQGFVLISFNLR